MIHFIYTMLSRGLLAKEIVICCCQVPLYFFLVLSLKDWLIHLHIISYDTCEHLTGFCNFHFHIVC
jgi:hypothetical protein